MNCNAVEPETQLRCHLEPGHKGRMHQAWAHYPAQLCVWPVAEEHTVGDAS